MKKISLQSSQIVTLCENPLAFGGSWGEDGNIIAGLNLHLARVPSGGGMPTFLTDLAPGEIIHRWPQILPGGQAVLFTAYTSMTGLDGATIEVLSLKDRRRKTLVRVGTYGRYLPSGYLAYLDKGTLFAVPFALDRLEVRGTPTPILENVSYSSAWGSAQIDFSRTGTLVYQGGKVGAGLVTVQWLDQSGNGRPLIPVPGNYLSPTLSPDGSRLALTAAGDIWVYELGQGSMTRLTFGGGYGNPLWSPDGQYIVFRAAQGIWWTRADGTSQAQPLTKAGVQQIAWSFTGDGKRLAFVQTNAQHRAGLWTLPIATDRSGLSAGKEDLYLQTPFDSRGPMFSPDGRWIAYQSNESGTYQVYAQAFPDKHGKQQVSDLGGTIPAWSRNGHELFYWQTGPQRRLMVVSYQERGDSFITDKPRVWMESGLIPFTTTRSYDPAPDGRHIVALMPADAPSETHDRVTFLLNFFDELRRRAPQNPN